jgi:hypothetical protein
MDFLRQVPEALADEAAVDVLVSKAKPAIVSREEEAIGPDEGKLVRLKLSNGVRVSYRRNTARPQVLTPSIQEPQTENPKPPRPSRCSPHPTLVTKSSDPASLRRACAGVSGASVGSGREGDGIC